MYTDHAKVFAYLNTKLLSPLYVQVVQPNATGLTWQHATCSNKYAAICEFKPTPVEG